MSALKCAQCGLVNFATDTTCKRCRAPLMSSVSSVSGVSGVASLPSVVSSTPLGIVLEDGYVLPPPPSLGMPGVWRHKATLVMSKDALLPDRCVKCNVPTPGRLKRKLSWHHPAIYIIVLFAILIYLIVALILRKTATVDIGICDEHRAKRRRNILITWVLFVLGVGGFILAITTEDPTYLLFGTVALFGALIFGLVAVRIVTPSKIDDKFVWLKGVNKEYLDELPQWVG